MSETTSKQYKVVDSPYFSQDAPRDGDVGELEKVLNDGRVIVLRFGATVYHFLPREVEELGESA